MCGNRYLCNTDLKPIQLFYKVCFHNFTGKKLNYLLICIVGRILATAHVTGRRTGIEIRGQGIGSPGWGSGMGVRSGRQVVSQLDERQSAVESLSLLLEAALGCSSLGALLLLCGLFFPVLFIRLEKLHWILLLLVLPSSLALWLHLGGCRGTLLTGSPVPAMTKSTLPYNVNKTNKKSYLNVQIFLTVLLLYIWAYFHLLCQPLCHSLVIHRLSLPQTLLWFFPLQTGERMLGAVSVSMCKPIATSCRGSIKSE